MEPMLPQPHNFETTPPEKGGEVPVSRPASAESAPNTNIERSRENTGSPPPKTRPGQADDTKPPVTGAPLPQMVQPLGTTAVSNNDNPAIADDVDVIEKEWVDKAKKIVSSTKDDPHKQEKEVSKLQADYLMKRYGKQIKLTE